MEIETLLTIAARLKLLARQEALVAWDLSQQVGRMLRRQIESLNKVNGAARKGESRRRV